MKSKGNSQFIAGLFFSKNVCSIDIVWILSINKNVSISVLVFGVFWFFLFNSDFFHLIRIENLNTEVQQNERNDSVKQIILSSTLWAYNIHMDNTCWRLPATSSLVSIPFPQPNSWTQQSAVKLAVSCIFEVMKNLLWCTLNSFLTYTYYRFTIIYLGCWISLLFFTPHHTTVVKLNYNAVTFPFKNIRIYIITFMLKPVSNK